MHKMQTIATNDKTVGVSDCLRRAKTAEWIEVLFGVKSPGKTGTLY